jgi:hypothetical protein
MKKIWFVIIAFSFLVQVNAQHKKTAGKIYLIPQIALLNGANATSKQMMFTAGIKRNDWCIGLGAALDYYEVRTIPLFMDIRREISHKRHPFFAYSDIGLNLPDAKKTEYLTPGLGLWWPPRSKSTFDRGLYGEVGIGYALYNRKKRGILLSAGYSIKTITEKYTETIYGYPTYPQDQQTIKAERRFDYQYRRFVFKIGYRLW